MEQAGGPIPLAELGRIAGSSARQVQRDFTMVGVSPAAYGRAVRTQEARRALRDGGSVLDALHDAGYGSVRAFYEETGRRLGMTPSQYAAAGAHLPLVWGTTPTAIGQVIAVASPAGLCAVRIGSTEADLVQQVTEEFTAAVLIRDQAAMTDVLRALRDIPAGRTRTYTEVAEQIGAPTSVRAVAAACARNPIALAIPCHRVIRTDGSLAGYRWGLQVKEQLLRAEREDSRTSHTSD